MATFQLRRFSRPEALKEMAPRLLLQLLEPHQEYFRSCGLHLPDAEGAAALDYEKLARLLFSPDETFPAELANALYIVHEMATPEGMDALLALGEISPALERDGADLTPADVALRFWLEDPEALERKHVEMRYLVRPRSFELFGSRNWPAPELLAPSETRVQELERTLSAWFSSKRRGPSSRVHLFDRGAHVWILIRHGDPLKREGSVEGEESGSVFYRPEKWDVAVFVRRTGELRMNAGSQGELELYRQAIGEHLFGGADTFMAADRYTLEPLREQGRGALACLDIEGLESIVLKEIWYFWRQGGEVEIRKAKDIFGVLEQSGRAMPRKAPILRAKFEVRFTGQKGSRMVTIQSRKTQFKRDEDSLLVEKWLQARGFVLPREEADAAA